MKLKARLKIPLQQESKTRRKLRIIFQRKTQVLLKLILTISFCKCSRKKYNLLLFLREMQITIKKEVYPRKIIANWIHFNSRQPLCFPMIQCVPNAGSTKIPVHKSHTVIMKTSWFENVCSCFDLHSANIKRPFDIMFTSANRIAKQPTRVLLRFP